MTLRRKLWNGLDPEARVLPGFSLLNKIIISVILLSVVSALLGTEQALTEGYEEYWNIWDNFVVSFFAIEYTGRIWVCVENSRNGSGWRGRLRYALSLPALIDLAVLAPAILFSVGSEAYVARLFRLMRILQLARLGRFSRAMDLMATALHQRRTELQLSLAVAVVLVIVSSTLLYVVEGGHQPESFGSIPRAMWWSIATLTTVGYGDVVPVTPLGRMLSAITAIMGIGLIAMPAGILASAFSDALEERRRKDEAE